MSPRDAAVAALELADRIIGDFPREGSAALLMAADFFHQAGAQQDADHCLAAARKVERSRRERHRPGLPKKDHPANWRAHRVQ